MKNLSQLSDAELLQTTRLHVERSHEMDADLLLLLGEIDERRLYAERAFSSMFDFCTRELNFSEDVACNRIALAKLARRLPRVLDFVRDGRIHLSGLGLLAKHLTEENADSEDGRRCEERGGLEFEHIEGFARTGQHTVEGLTLHCRTHNQLAADRLYGRDVMDSKRRRIRTGADKQGALL
jgi:hypothetical protein